jgi:hypothetical protein
VVGHARIRIEKFDGEVEPGKEPVEILIFEEPLYESNLKGEESATN